VSSDESRRAQVHEQLDSWSSRYPKFREVWESMTDAQRDNYLNWMVASRWSRERRARVRATVARAVEYGDLRTQYIPLGKAVSDGLSFMPPL